MKKKNKKETLKLKWYTHEEIFGRYAKDKEFVRAFEEETARIKLAKQIRDLRTARQMTQQMVARKTKMPQSVIARIESGERGISVETLGRVARAFGKRVELV